MLRQGHKMLTIPYLEPSGSYNYPAEQAVEEETIPYLEPSGSYNPRSLSKSAIMTIPYLEPSGSYNVRGLPWYDRRNNTIP